MPTMNRKKVTIKKIALSNSQLVCHPAALKSYHLSNKFRYQYLNQLNKLPLETIKQIQLLDPIHVVHQNELGNKKQFYFFSGWFWLLLCRELNINEITIILHQNIETTFIEEASWLYILVCEMKCMNRKVGLGQLSTMVNDAPNSVIKTILGDHYSYSSTTTIENISNESRDVLQGQVKNLSSLVNTKKSILDELLQET